MLLCILLSLAHNARMQAQNNGSDVIAQWVEIERDGSPMRSYFAAPRNAGDATPTVVLAMHLTGIDRSMRNVANRFAESGFGCIIPDLYARFDAPDGDLVEDYKLFLPYAAKLAKETVDPDIRAGAAWLRAQHPRTKIAIAGFCMGGIMALVRAIGYSDIFNAAAVWYGAIRIDPKLVEIPVVGNYGAEDHGIPVDTVEAFRAALPVPNDIVIYPNAGHAFADDTRPAYEKNAADDSWRRSLAFLRRYLE